MGLRACPEDFDDDCEDEDHCVFGMSKFCWIKLILGSVCYLGQGYLIAEGHVPHSLHKRK